MTSHSEINIQGDNVYYNVRFVNDRPNGKNVAIHYRDNRNDYILDDSHKYELLVQRFQIPLDDLPFFIWDKSDASPITDNIYVGQPDNTKYKVYIKNPSGEYTQDISYIDLSSISSINPPDVNLRIFNVQHFISIINNGIYQYL